MRLIDADALAKKLTDWSTGTVEPIDWSDIAEAPTIDAVEVVHGEWIERIGGISKELFYQCSKCYGEVDKDEFDYCPWCGAKMYGERKESE